MNPRLSGPGEKRNLEEKAAGAVVGKQSAGFNLW